MASNRRMGPRDAAVPTALLDATEAVMREEGYGAVSSRRVAEAAGVKQQLVYYYFRTMDDLLLATFKRRTARALERLERFAGMARPLRAIWEDQAARSDSRLSFEFMALANHHAGIREEVARFMTEERRAIAGLIERQMAAKGGRPDPLTAGAAAFLLHAVSLMLGREVSSGIDEGHHDVRALAEWALARFD